MLQLGNQKINSPRFFIKDLDHHTNLVLSLQFEEVKCLPHSPDYSIILLFDQQNQNFLKFRFILRIENFKFEGSSTDGFTQIVFASSYHLQITIGKGKISPIPQDLIVSLEVTVVEPVSVLTNSPTDH